QVANNDEPGGDADAHLQLVPGRPPAQGGRSGDGGRAEPSDCRNDIEAGAHGTLGIIFVRAGVAKVDEHAITHVLRYEPIETAYRLSDAGMIAADDLA